MSLDLDSLYDEVDLNSLGSTSSYPSVGNELILSDDTGADSVVLDTYVGQQGALSAGDFDSLSDSEYLIMRWDLFMPEIYRRARNEVILDTETMKMKTVAMYCAPAVRHLFYEVAVNATDNKRRSEQRNYNEKVKEVRVTVTQTRVTVRNGGIPIPIEKKRVPVYFGSAIVGYQEPYVAELIFSMPRAGGNFSTIGKDTMGRNGQGAKLTNAWSKMFNVKVWNAEQQLYYEQTWTNNMNNKTEAIVRPEKIKESAVEVSYDLDFELFGRMNREKGIPWPEDITSYTAEDIAIFHKLCIGLSNGSKVPFVFNGVRFDYSDDLKYFKLFIESGSRTIKYEDDLNYTINTPQGQKNWIGKATVIIADTPYEGKTISMVNGGETANGGVHVEDIEKLVLQHIIDIVKESKETKDAVSKKKKSDDTGVNLTIRAARDHVSFFISVNVPDPEYTDQSKHTLRLPKPRYRLKKEQLQQIERWKVIRMVKDGVDLKMLANLSKDNVKPGERIDNRKVKDATEAGKAERHKCVMHVCEGLSGRGFADKMVEMTPTRRKYKGTSYIQGNFLNTRGLSKAQLLKDKEVRMLIQVFGLEFDENTGKGIDYKIPQNRAKLRYGMWLICSDQDFDGFHIDGLQINFIEEYFPSLLEIGFVAILETSIVRVWRGEQSIGFKTLDKFAIWWNNVPHNEKRLYRIKYNKGLGSSSAKETKLELAQNSTITVVFDSSIDDSKHSINLAFNKKWADARKKWIEVSKPIFDVDDVNYISISKLIGTRVILHAIDTVCRTIAHSADGFKESVRKIVYGLVWWFNDSKRKGRYPKVNELANVVTGEFGYHHGADVLMDVCIRQAANFVGGAANNLPIIPEESNFGSRYENGADASKPRYAHVGMVYWLNEMFPQEDKHIYKHKIIEDKECEPENLYPTLPMHVINGVRSIATGWSSFIPSHDVREVIVALKERLCGRPWPLIYPYFTGFKGNCYLVNTRRGIRFVTEGLWGTGSNGYVRITELPVGVIPASYVETLYKRKEAGEIVQIVNNCVGAHVEIELFGCKNFEPYKYKMRRSIPMSNYVLNTDIVCDTYLGRKIEPRPRKFNGISEVLEAFYQSKLHGIGLRKQHKLDMMKKDIDDLEKKIKVITVIRPVISQYINWTDEQVNEWAAPYGFTTSDINVRLSEIKSADLQKLIAKKDVLMEKYKEYEQISLEYIWYEDIIAFEKKYCAVEKLQPKTVNDLVQRVVQIDKTDSEFVLEDDIEDEVIDLEAVNDGDLRVSEVEEVQKDEVLDLNVEPQEQDVDLSSITL